MRPSKAAQPKRVVLSVPLAGVRCVASFDGGKSAARGPCTLKVPRGYVQLTVTRAGYASYKQRVLVVEQRTVHRVALDRRTKRIVTPAQLAASRRKTKPIKASGGRKPPATKKPTSPSYWP